MSKKEYFVFVEKEKVIVSEEVYKAYWQETNREEYAKRSDIKNGLLYFSNEEMDKIKINRISDSEIDVEKIVETKMRIEELRKAIEKLTPEEREIIDRIYYKDETLRKIAKNKKISHPALIKRRKKILEKLKELLKEFEYEK